MRMRLVKIMAVLTAVICFVVTMIPTAFAIEQSYLPDRTKDVTLTLNALNADGVTFEGVGFTLYFVSSDLTNIPKLEDIDVSKLAKVTEVTTDSNGKASVTLKPEQQGVYLIKNTKVPDTVTSAAGDFLITLPYTIDGKEWKYDVEASPKFALKVEETVPTSPKTTGSITASTADTSKGTATTGESAMWLLPIACICAVAFCVMFAGIKKAKKKKQD